MPVLRIFGHQGYESWVESSSNPSAWSSWCEYRKLAWPVGIRIAEHLLVVAEWDVMTRRLDISGLKVPINPYSGKDSSTSGSPSLYVSVESDTKSAG